MEALRQSAEPDKQASRGEAQAPIAEDDQFKNE
jgi:hypothetical protein